MSGAGKKRLSFAEMRGIEAKQAREDGIRNEIEALKNLRASSAMLNRRVDSMQIGSTRLLHFARSILQHSV
jgi:hypothetical protein